VGDDKTEMFKKKSDAVPPLTGLGVAAHYSGTVDAAIRFAALSILVFGALPCRLC
jgi:hypothetical protein